MTGDIQAESLLFCWCELCCEWCDVVFVSDGLLAVIGRATRSASTLAFATAMLKQKIFVARASLPHWISAGGRGIGCPGKQWSIVGNEGPRPLPA
jgi:hypothetical protein